MADWMPLLGGIAEGIGTYYAAQASAEAQQYIADIQLQIANLNVGSATYQADMQRLTALETAAMQYPGQMETGQNLADYLDERIGLGLTDVEQQLYRTKGKGMIEKGIAAGTEGIETTYASQGLRGGAVAEAVGGLESQRPELYGGLESRIMEADIGAREQNISQALAFLQTSAAPRSPTGESVQPTTPVAAPPAGGGLPGGPTPAYQPVSVGGGTGGIVGGRMGGATPFTQPLHQYGTPIAPGGGGDISSALAQLASNPNISSRQFRHRADIIRGVELADVQGYYEPKNAAQRMLLQSGAYQGQANPYRRIGAGGAWTI